MTVYVDDWQQQARVGRLSAKWSHLRVGPFDDIEELHEFAARLGLQRRWFQGKSWPRQHYDVTETKRQAAIAAGAVAISWKETGRQIVRARDAQRRASQQLVCTRGGQRTTPADDELWPVAKALYELASMKAPAPAAAEAGPAEDVLF